MSRPTALRAFKFYKAKFPAATVGDVEALINIMSTASTLNGAFRSSTMALKQVKSYEELDELVEMVSHYRFSLDYVLRQYFGVSRAQYPDFDPVELRDGFGDPRIIALFKGKK